MLVKSQFILFIFFRVLNTAWHYITEGFCSLCLSLSSIWAPGVQDLVYLLRYHSCFWHLLWFFLWRILDLPLLMSFQGSRSYPGLQSSGMCKYSPTNELIPCGRLEDGFVMGTQQKPHLPAWMWSNSGTFASAFALRLKHEDLKNPQTWRPGLLLLRLSLSQGGRLSPAIK